MAAAKPAKPRSAEVTEKVAPENSQEGLVAPEQPAPPKEAPEQGAPEFDKGADQTEIETPELPAPTHRISGVPEKGFCRAGRRWPREGVDVSKSAFTEEQWAALEAEKNVVVKELK